MLGKIVLTQTISPIVIHFSVAWSVVCLSVDCHISAHYLNRSTDVHATH